MIGIKQGILTGIKTGIRTGITGGIGTGFPSTFAELKAIQPMMIGGGSIWMCDSLSGNLPDTGPNNLTMTPVGTPLYRQGGPVPGKFAVGLNTATDSFTTADSTKYNLVAGHEVNMLLVFRNTGGAANYLSKATATNVGYRVFTDGTNLTLHSYDGTATAQVQIADTFNTGAWHMLTATILNGSVVGMSVTNPSGVGYAHGQASSTVGAAGNTNFFRFTDATNGSIAYCAVTSIISSSIYTSAASLTTFTNFARYTGFPWRP